MAAMPSDTINVTDAGAVLVGDHVGQVTARVENQGAVSVTCGEPGTAFGDGTEVAAGEDEEFDLAPGETLHAIAAAGTNADVDVSW